MSKSMLSPLRAPRTLLLNRTLLMTALMYLGVCLCWGTTWLGIKIAVSSVPPLTAAGLRFVLAFPLFWLFARWRGEPLLFPAGRQGFFWLITLGYFALPYYLLNAAEQQLSSGLTALLFSSMPIFILLFSRLLLAESIHRLQVIGILLGFSSLAMILHEQGVLTWQTNGQTELLSVVAILAAAGLHGFCYVMTKKQGAAISVITFNTLPIGLAGILLLLCGSYWEQPQWQAVSQDSWLALAYLGWVASVGGFLLYFYLLKRMSPVLLSYVFLIFPLFALLISAWFEQQALSPQLWLYVGTLLLGFLLTKQQQSMPVAK